MIRYEKYSDIGILGMPQTPSHWNKVRNKSFLKVAGVQVGDRRNEYPLLSLTTKGIILRDIESGKGKFPKDFDTYQIVKKDDLVFCLFDIDETPRTVGLVEVEGMITGAYTVFSVNQNIALPKYIYYFYVWVDNIKGLRPYYSGLRKTVRSDKFLMLYIPLPPFVEQEKVVSYLEDKTSKIDEVIWAKEKQIKLLQELKDVEIANVITRGLNPDVKMKDSGISWIGQIPDHWEVVRLKTILTESKEKTSVDGGMLLSLSQYTGIMPKDSTNKMGMFEAESTVGYNIVHPGQFVMNIMLAWNGSYAVSDYEGVISPAYCVFNFNVDCEKKYFHYLLRLPAYSGAFKTQSKGIIDSRLRLYPQYFLAFKTIVPPIEEQRLIVDYIESKCNKADSLISDLEAEIDYLGTVAK